MNDAKIIAAAAKFADALREADVPVPQSNPFDAIARPDHVAAASEGPRVLAPGEATAIANGIDQLIANGDIARLRNVFLGLRSLFGMFGVVA